MARIPYSKGDGSGGYTPLPEGTYDFRIFDTVMGNSKSSGSPQLQLKMEVLEGSKAGKKVSCWYSLLPQSGWKVDRLLDALEITREETGELDENGQPVLEFDDEWLLNRCIQFDVTQREYNGRKNNDFLNERMSPLDPEYGAEGADAGEEGSDESAREESEPARPKTSKGRQRPKPRTRS